MCMVKNPVVVRKVIILSLLRQQYFVVFVIYFVVDVYLRQVRGVKNMTGIKPAQHVSNTEIIMKQNMA